MKLPHMVKLRQDFDDEDTDFRNNPFEDSSSVEVSIPNDFERRPKNCQLIWTVLR